MSRERRVSASASSEANRGRAESSSRAISSARLVSPVPSGGAVATPIRQVPTPSQLDTGNQTPLSGVEHSASLPGPGQSALAAALRGEYGRSPPRFGTPPLRALSPAVGGAVKQGNGPHTDYGSFGGGPQDRSGSTPIENPEIIRRHLVQPPATISADGDGSDYGSPGRRSSAMGAFVPRSALTPSQKPLAGQGLEDEEFSSLQLQGGDITRQVYRWTEEAEAQSQGRGRGQRSKSFHLSRPQPESDILDIQNIKVPGGFRRNYLRRAADELPPTRQYTYSGQGSSGAPRSSRAQQKLFTSNFLEFLTLYGHFAGEELEEDDEVLGPDEYFSSDAYNEGDFYDEDADDSEGRRPGEDSPLLTPGTHGRRKRKPKERKGGNNTSFGAALLLLKSFVGTGVLFLPKAYLNGGMVFSNIILIALALLSYFCFTLLVKTRLKVDGSFGDIGGMLYGKTLRALILSSIVLSQIGFVSAYIVFSSSLSQAFILAVSDCRTWIDIKYMILTQLMIYLPLSLIRDISKLGATALIADVFILLGLIYLYYYDIFTIVTQHGVSDIVSFNPRDWTLFIGTAIFTFEGIGLIIPIQESMKHPTQFPPVLGGVMIIITVLFVSIGALSYAAYGSGTSTIVISNLPQDSHFVNAVQFLYSLAILLSTPLQLFPAIRITENELFSRSGKYNPYIKWQKNVFRFFLVILCGGIAWGGADDLDKFVALVGSFACVPLVYIYPVSSGGHLYLILASITRSIADRFVAAAPSPPSRGANQTGTDCGHCALRVRRCRHGVYDVFDDHELGESAVGQGAGVL